MAEYERRNNHPIPAGPVVVRHEYLRDRCKGHRVLSLGGGGPLEQFIRPLTAALYCIDIEPKPSVTIVDLDKEPDQLRAFTSHIDLILCGEILEHLSNPGRLLDVLRWMRKPMVVTAPNAFTTVGRWLLDDGIENVNAEHVCWYSPITLRTLLTRHGFKVTKFCWYNGKPIYAEGMIFEVQ